MPQVSGGVHRGASRLQAPLCAVRAGQKNQFEYTILMKENPPSAQDKKINLVFFIGERKRKRKRKK